MASGLGSRYPATFGDYILTKTRVLYMKKMEGSDFFLVPDRLVGFAAGAPEYEQDEAVKGMVFKFVRGQVRKFMKTFRKQNITGVNFELQYPPGAAWTPVNKVARSRALCRRDFFVVHECSTDDRFKYFQRFTEAVISEPTGGQPLVSAGEDEVPIEHTSQVSAVELREYWQLKVQEMLTDGEADPLYAVGLVTTDCDDCDDDQYDTGLFAGGDGTAAPILDRSTNGFVSSSPVSNSLAVGSIITDVLTKGNKVWLTYADEIDTAAGTATTGGVLVSTDGGLTFAVASGATAPLYALADGNGYIWAVGAAGAIYRSGDGLTFSAFTNPLALAALHYTDIAHDPENNRLYLAGYNATNSRAHYILGDSVVDISTDVNAGANLLFRVAVLEGNHVVYGGATGTVREHAKATDGGTWTTVSVNGTTDAIRAIGGDKARTLIGAGTKVYERSLLTDQAYKALPYNDGTSVGGNILSGYFGHVDMGVDFAVFGTSTGEVLRVNTYLPDAA